MSSITQLEYLVAVDKHRHFGRAAKECGVSQPSLSMQLQKLEEQLNVIIFDRSKKPILPTDVGKEIILQAKVVLREHKRMENIPSTSTEISGNFKLGIIPTLAPYLIPLFVGEFSKQYPKVNLIINEHKTDEITTLLYDDKLDGGLLVTPLKDPQIIERPLFYEPFYIFASENHPFYKRKIVSESELSGEDLWILGEGHCFRNQVLNVCSRGNRANVLKNVTFESGNFETLKNLVRTNHGFTLLPFLATQGLLPSEKTNMLKKFQKPTPTREVSLIHSRSFLKEKIIEALEQIIVQKIPKNLKSLKTGDLEIVDI